MITGPVGKHLQAGTEGTEALFSTARHHSDEFMIPVPDINIQTYLLTVPYVAREWDVHGSMTLGSPLIFTVRTIKQFSTLKYLTVLWQWVPD